MTKPQKPEVKCRSPRSLVERADDGLLSVVRSTGKAIGGLSLDTVDGFSKIGQVLTGRKQKTAAGKTKFSADVPPRQPEKETEAAAIESPDPRPDLETLLEGRSPQDADQVAVLRKALDDLLLGSEEAGESALKTLVALGLTGEPLLVACLPTDSPRVARIALEGLSRIGSERLIDCISDVLGSPDRELRLVALRAVVGLPDDRQQQPLLERGLRDPNAEVRRQTLGYVAWQSSYWAITEAMRLCNDKAPEVQWAAVEALTALRPSEANSILQLLKPSLAPVNWPRADILLQGEEDRKSPFEKNEDERRIPNASQEG